MKLIPCLLASCVLAVPARADEIFVDATSDPQHILCDNGNIQIANVGNCSVTPSKWFRLSTNSSYMVVCQIVYDYAAPLETAADIMRVRQVESCLNLALLKFLQSVCEGKTDAELANRYQKGSIQLRVDEEFAEWFDKVKLTLARFHDKTALDDATVQAVSMRAVGAFAEAIEEL